MEPCLVIEPADEFRDQKARNEIEKEVLSRLKACLPGFEISQIRFENSLPVDARHNAKIHRLALAKKWTQKLVP